MALVVSPACAQEAAGERVPALAAKASLSTANAESASTLAPASDPAFWQDNRRVAIMAAAALTLHGVLLSGLLVERRRRQHTQKALKRNLFQLAHASRRMVAGELTGSIAHEINQPLGAIQTNAKAADLLLASGMDRSPQIAEILHDIGRDAMRASEIVRRLRALLQNNQIEHAPFDVNAVVLDAEHVLRPEALRRQVHFNIAPAPAPIAVVGDAIQIQQVILNLVLNAMDALATQAPERRTVSLAVKRLPNGVDIAVMDRGHGVPPERLDRIFDSFFTTKPTGTWLGLSIARTLVESHNGRIWAESGLREGARFHVFLPTPEGAGCSRG